jgi:hypothetical protein
MNAVLAELETLNGFRDLVPDDYPGVDAIQGCSGTAFA